MKRGRLGWLLLVVGIAPETAWATEPDPARCAKGAVIIAIDRSTSMEGAPIAMAKRAALGIADGLDPSVCYGVVAFDATATVIAPLARDRARAKTNIAAIATSPGTDLRGALDVAGKALLGVASSRRAVVLLSDGQAPSHGIGDLDAFFETEGVVVSTIGLGDSVDLRLLRRIAGETHGRAVLARDPEHLRALFGGEIARVVGW